MTKLKCAKGHEFEYNPDVMKYEIDPTRPRKHELSRFIEDDALDLREPIFLRMILGNLIGPYCPLCIRDKVQAFLADISLEDVTKIHPGSLIEIDGDLALIECPMCAEVHTMKLGTQTTCDRCGEEFKAEAVSQ